MGKIGFKITGPFVEIRLNFQKNITSGTLSISDTQFAVVMCMIFSIQGKVIKNDLFNKGKIQNPKISTPEKIQKSVKKTPEQQDFLQVFQKVAE